MDIFTLFPELNKIELEDLRQKTALALTKTIELGGWTELDIKTLPFTLLIPELIQSDNTPLISIVDHIRAVAMLCINVFEIYQELGLSKHLNKDELISGALLHDVGKFLEYTRELDGKIVQTKAGKMLRHPAQGLEIVSEFHLPLVVRQAIIFHSKEGNHINREPEVEIIHRCDFLSFIPVKKILQK
ncbi:MAG: HD domain-containing protein [Candidatus Hodarchaeales archaeon]|jgi:putative nucleotidyltransferase with HDIG domain